VQSNCPWQSTTNVDWIALGTGGTSGTPINYKVAANTCVGSRVGTISLRTNLPNPPTLAVTQDGSPNNMSLAPSSATADATANNYRITVTTGDVCNWSAVAENWIQITVGRPARQRRILPSAGNTRHGVREHPRGRADLPSPSRRRRRRCYRAWAMPPVCTDAVCPGDRGPVRQQTGPASIVTTTRVTASSSIHVRRRCCSTAAAHGLHVEGTSER
jgi:hypothetical protein